MCATQPVAPDDTHSFCFSWVLRTTLRDCPCCPPTAVSYPPTAISEWLPSNRRAGVDRRQRFFVLVFGTILVPNAKACHFLGRGVLQWTPRVFSLLEVGKPTSSHPHPPADSPRAWLVFAVDRLPASEARDAFSIEVGIEVGMPNKKPSSHPCSSPPLTGTALSHPPFLAHQQHWGLVAAHSPHPSTLKAVPAKRPA